MRIFMIFICCLFLYSCDDLGEQKTSLQSTEPEPPKLVLTKASFADLPDWGADDFKGFAQGFTRSCARIAKRPPSAKFGVLKEAGTNRAWQRACAKFKLSADWTPQGLKSFFETYFTPYQVSADDETVGLFTGYYEASLNGSRTRTARYNIPLHKRPDDLVMVQLGDFRESLKGNRIAGRVTNGRLKPYESREEIVSGDWPHDDETLIWVDSAVDAFFVQIQGSGLVQMREGGTMRIGYAGQNGHPYYAIGRELIKMGALTKKNVSMQSIRKWLEDNPKRADEIMNTNKSYVFFTEIKGEGPIGAEGVALTAQRSLAVDRTLLSYGLPLWVDIAHPQAGKAAMRRMMIAQDTGGAIIGPVRGDVFWGYGEYAEDMAGIMKSKGRYWALLPKR